MKGKGRPAAHVLALQALAFERLLLVVKTQPMTQQPASRPRLAELKPVNENITVDYAARSSDAQQRVPLEPLFHINTDAAAAAQPTSIDEASENRSGNTEAHMPAAKVEHHASAVPATRSTDAGSLEAAIATDSPASGPVELLSYCAYPNMLALFVRAAAATTCSS